jgi:hypothetical protein
MTITDYFKQTFTLKRKQRTTNDSGVVKEALVEVSTFLGILDPKGSSYSFDKLREEFDFDDVLFAPVEDIQPDDVITWAGTDYNVVSVVDPLYRQHHLEVLLKRVG